MLLVMTWLVVFTAGLAWRLNSAVLCLQVLLAGVAILALAAATWHPVARRRRHAHPRGPFIDLEQRRIAEADSYVREQLAAGASAIQIASSAHWFDSEGDARDRPR